VGSCDKMKDMRGRARPAITLTTTDKKETNNDVTQFEISRQVSRRLVDWSHFRFAGANC